MNMDMDMNMGVDMDMDMGMGMGMDMGMVLSKYGNQLLLRVVEPPPHRLRLRL